MVDREVDVVERLAAVHTPMLVAREDLFTSQ